MSRKSLVPVNVPALASAPTTPTIRTGDLYFNTTDNTLYSYNGTTWAASSGGGGGGGASVTIDGTAPTSPTEGSLWFDSDTGQFFIYYDSYWLEVGAGSSAAPQAIISQASAPADTSALWLDTDEPAVETIPANIVDAKGDIVVATADNAPARLGVGSDGAMLMANSSAATGLSWVGPTNVAGKNKIINGDFSVNQRGFVSTTSTGVYNYDRWTSTILGDGTVTLSAQVFVPGSAPTSGYESTNYLQTIITGQTSTSSATLIKQRIEDVRTFANQTVTVSLWAKSSSGTPSISAEFVQVFGTGGSSAVNSIVSSPIKKSINTTWARYFYTISVPSISGKTIGPNSTLELNLWLSAGSDFNSRTGSLGIQSNTFGIWGIQVEAGSVATPFTLAGGGSQQAELALCQRYYYRQGGAATYQTVATGWGNATNLIQTKVVFPVTMRTTPTVLDYSNLIFLDQVNAGIAVSGLSIVAGQSSPNLGYLTVSSATGVTQYRAYDLATNNSLSGYLGFGAEL